MSQSMFKWNFLPKTLLRPEKYKVYLVLATQLAATPCLATRSPSFGQTSGYILRPGTGHRATLMACEIRISDLLTFSRADAP